MARLARYALFALVHVSMCGGLAKLGRNYKKPEMQYIEVKADGSDAWRAEVAVEALKNGGVGVIPTDTSYSFVADPACKEAVARLLALKGNENAKKPLSLLCADLGTIDRYTRYNDKATFKVLKKALPGPYTFVLPASENLPRVVFKGGRQWKRHTVGVRLPDDAVSQFVLDGLDGPLFSSSVPTSEDGDQLVCMSPLQGGDAAWCENVDFVIDAGQRPIEGSTIYDLVEEPTMLRQGLGPPLDGL